MRVSACYFLITLSVLCKGLNISFEGFLQIPREINEKNYIKYLKCHVVCSEAFRESSTNCGFHFGLKQNTSSAKVRCIYHLAQSWDNVHIFIIEKNIFFFHSNYQFKKNQFETKTKTDFDKYMYQNLKHLNDFLRNDNKVEWYLLKFKSLVDSICIF